MCNAMLFAFLAINFCLVDEDSEVFLENIKSRSNQHQKLRHGKTEKIPQKMQPYTILDTYT